MVTPVILKIILTDGSSQRLTFRGGLPASIDDFMIEVKKQCGLEGNFRLQFKDSMFGNEFLNLTTVSEVEDKGTIKIIDMARPTLQQDERCTPVIEAHTFCSSSLRDSSAVFGGIMDTAVLSSSDSMSSRSS